MALKTSPVMNPPSAAAWALRASLYLPRNNTPCRRECPEPRRRRNSFPTLVGTHKLSFGQDVTIHRTQQFLLGRTGFQHQIDVERIKLQVIAVRFPWWRARPAVTDAFEIVDTLFGAKGQRLQG